MQMGMGALLMLALSLLSTGLRAEATADELQACMQANLPTALRVNHFEMTTVREDVTETLSGKLFLQRLPEESALTMQIESPSYYRGSAYLFIERAGKEQMFIYLPATGRVRQISGTSKDSAFFGSAFRYSDLRKAVGMMSEAAPERLADDLYDGGPVARLLLEQAAATVDGLPVRSTLQVETDRCVPLHLRVEREDTLLREFAGLRADITEDEGRWYLSKGTMIDHEQAIRTEVHLGQLRGFAEIPRSVFNRSSFYHAIFAKP